MFDEKLSKQFYTTYLSSSTISAYFTSAIAVGSVSYTLPNVLELVFMRNESPCTMKLERGHSSHS